MGRIDPTVRVLWLSDIHYGSNYKDKTELLELFLNAFEEYLIELKNEHKYDYILLSGDIAQFGHKADYDLFLVDILTKIKEYFAKSVLLVVPGNHDVNRDDVDYVQDFIKNLPNDRLQFFKNNEQKFKDSFSNYSSFFNIQDWEPKCPALIDNAYLFGFHIDTKKKIIFILLNSSWYSIGDEGFLEKYLGSTLQVGIIDLLKEIAQNIKDANLKNSIQQVLDNNKSKEISKILKDVSNITNEYGKQALCLSEIEAISEISNILIKYNDFVTVTVMHHPINWFDWPDRINDETFSKIRENTDLLLTGHEHVPLDFKPQHIENNSLLHIQAGCFMSFPKRGTDFKIDDNWFSTLEINTTKRTIKQYKHYFDEQNKNWFCSDKEPKYLPLNKKYSSNLSDIRYDEICDKFIISSYIQKRYNNVKDLGNSCFILNKSLHVFVTPENTDKEGNIIDSTIFNENLKLSNNKVHFVFFDINHEHYKAYFNTEDKMQVLDTIKSDYDYKFDTFRHKFFSELSQEQAEIYKKLKLMCEIVPYWILEKYL